MTPDFPACGARLRTMRFALLLAVLLAVLLAGCAASRTPLNDAVSATAPDEAPDAALRAVEAVPGGLPYAVDAAHSQVRILVFRAGSAARLGHNHVLTVPRLQGRLWTPAQGLAGARFALAFRLDELLLDPPAQRADLGAGWASVLAPDALAATREHMLGPDNLQAEAFPWVRLRSLQIMGEAPRLAAELEIELHGQRRRQWVALEARPSEQGGWAVSGSLVLSQSDYGVRPYSVLGGLLAVQDALVIDFGLELRPGPRTESR